MIWNSYGYKKRVFTYHHTVAELVIITFYHNDRFSSEKKYVNVVCNMSKFLLKINQSPIVYLSIVPRSIMSRHIQVLLCRVYKENYKKNERLLLSELCRTNVSYGNNI